MSVVVPVYKVEEYLPKCLESIINQTYKNLHILCIDDGSPDRCPTILDEYAKIDSRITVIHQNNSGKAGALNAALDYLFKLNQKKSELYSEFITFVDSDDFIDRDTYECAMSVFNCNIDLVYFGFEKVYENTEYKGKDRLKSDLSKSSSGPHFISDDDIHKMVVVWNKVFRTDIIFRNDIKFPDGLLYEDIYFTAAYLVHSSYAFYIDKYFYKYLQRNDSMSSRSVSSKDGAPLNFVFNALKLLDYLKEKNLYNNRQKVFWNVFYHWVCVAIQISHYKDDESTIYRLASKTISAEERTKPNIIQEHIDSLIISNNLKERYIFKFGGMFKIKHRINYDKYYVFGIPFVKICYSENTKIVSIVKVINFAIKKKLHS